MLKVWKDFVLKLRLETGMKLGEGRDNEWSYTVLVKYLERRYIPLDADCSGW